MLKGIITILISSILMRCGGWGEPDYFCPLIHIKYPKNKILRFIISRGRELIGLFVWRMYKNPLALLYILAVQVPYGEKSWLRDLVGRDANWKIYGFVYGLCSLSVLSFGLSVIQSLLGAVSFFWLMKQSNDGRLVSVGTKGASIDAYWYLDHSYVELLFPIGAMFFYIFK